MFFIGDAYTEYKNELEILKADDDLLEDQQKEISQKRDKIKDRVKNIAMINGDVKERLILPAGAFGAFDRQVTLKEKGINLKKLESILGSEKFKKLICIKETKYEPSQDKLNAARMSGNLTDDILAKCEEEGTPQYSLKKMNYDQFLKAKETYG